jgi:hypothetical protein
VEYTASIFRKQGSSKQNMLGTRKGIQTGVKVGALIEPKEARRTMKECKSSDRCG